MYIVFEGLEGVGKTTLAKIIAEDMSFKYVKTPSEGYTPARSYIAKSQSDLAKFYFYISSLYDIQTDLQDALLSQEGVIIDRYLLSTIAYSAGGSKFYAPSFDSNNLIKPDLTVHIKCNQSLRTQRKIERGFHIFERADVRDDAIETYFEEKSDMTFINEGPLDQMVLNLTNLIKQRLFEKK